MRLSLLELYRSTMIHGSLTNAVAVQVQIQLILAGVFFRILWIVVGCTRGTANFSSTIILAVFA